MSAVIRGAKGGSKQHTPVESPDNLRSIAFFRILDAVSEGEIGGLVNGQQSIFLDETPLANSDGTSNFPKAHIEERTGTQNQEAIPGFDSVENEISIGVELTDASAWLRSLSDVTLSAVRITLGVPALSKANTSNGDITGYTIAYKIEVSTDGGAFSAVYNGSFTGKTTTKFQRSHRIDLPDATTGWQIKVTRLTANAHSSAIADTTTVDSYTEIVDAKLRYPNTALIGVMGDASQFQNIPQRAYELWGRIIQVPSNYDVTTREYTGVWDGTFVPSWTDNPAWIFYDLVTHPRYGLGHLVTAAQVDKWELYRIGQYCDGMVDDGNGGLEPRLTCNIYLQTQADAYKLLNDLSTAFRGISYWANGSIVASADMPADPVYTYTDANVIDGKFSYSASGRKTRYTTALVSWNDPRNFYRTKVEYVEDRDGIARYGIQQTEVTAVGCASQGQAQRLGRWILLTSRLETDTVTFSVGLDGTLAAPGQIIRIADSARAGKRQGGRIHSATTTAVTVDKAPAVAIGDSLTAIMSDGVSQTRTVSGVLGAVISVSPGFSEAPAAQTMWVVESSTLAAQTFRVLAVTEDKSDTDISFTITALQHNDSKFDAIDNGTIVQVPPISALTVTKQPGPTTVGLSSREVVNPVATYSVLSIGWTSVPGALSYEGDWRQDDGEWHPIGTQTGLTADIVGVSPGDYIARIRAKGTGGAYSLYTLSGTLTIDPPSTLPTSVGGIKDTADTATPAWIINPNGKDSLPGTDKPANWSSATNPTLGGWYTQALSAFRPNPSIETYIAHAGTGSPDGAGSLATDTLLNEGRLPVTPGEVVVASCQIRPQGFPTELGYGQINISWRDATDAEIGKSYGNGIFNILGTQTSTVIGAAPSGSLSAAVEFHVDGNTSGYLMFSGTRGFAQVINRVTDDANTTRTASVSDNELVVRGTNAAGLVITIPPESSEPWPIGATLYALQGNDGEVSFLAGSGVTFDVADSYATRAPGSLIAMKRTAPDEWQACGDLAYTAPATTLTGNATNAAAQPQNIAMGADGEHLIRRGGLIVSEALNAANTAFTPAGDLTATDVQAAIEQAATLGSGGGGILPLVTGEAPPVLVYLDDGSLVYVEVA